MGLGYSKQGKMNTVPEYKSSRCAVAQHLGWREGDFTHLHLLAVSFRKKGETADAAERNESQL